jgi:hypothetical protein
MNVRKRFYFGQRPGRCLRQIGCPLALQPYMEAKLDLSEKKNFQLVSISHSLIENQSSCNSSAPLEITNFRHRLKEAAAAQKLVFTSDKESFLLRTRQVVRHDIDIVQLKVQKRNDENPALK